MSNQIPVLYTEHKTKKVKIWLDGYLVPRSTLNSARLISAGKHEIDVVFYSSIDEIKPGREFETDRYLITVEENDNDDQPCPRPSFAVNDPTMKNKPKSAGFVPPRLVPKAEPPPPPVPMVSLERHNPHQWGYAGMTTSMKRNANDDDDDHSSHQPKMTKASNFIPPTFHKREPIQSAEPQQQSFLPPPPQQQQPGLLNDTLISRLLGNSHQIEASPVKQSAHISWSTWDEKKSDDEESAPVPSDENILLPTKQTYNWHSLIKSAGENCRVENETKPCETMPKFDFDDNSFDTLFDNLDE